MSMYNHMDGIKDWQGRPTFFYRQALPEAKQHLRKEDPQHFYKSTVSDSVVLGEYPLGFYGRK